MVSQENGDIMEELKQFEGTWICVKSENVDELLLELGVPFILRQLVNCSKSCQDITVRGTEVDIICDVGFCTNKMTVRLGEEVEVNRLDVMHKCMSRFEAGKLIITQTPMNSEIKEQILYRELINHQMVMTVYVGSVQCKRFFRKKTQDDELPLNGKSNNCDLMKIFSNVFDETK